MPSSSIAKAVKPSKGVSLAELWCVVQITRWANGHEARIRSGTSARPNEWGWKCTTEVIYAPMETIPDGAVEMDGYELYNRG